MPCPLPCLVFSLLPFLLALLYYYIVLLLLFYVLYYYIALPCLVLPNALPCRLALTYLTLSCLVFSLLPFLLALLYYYIV
jgi:hypothetical protein